MRRKGLRAAVATACLAVATLLAPTSTAAAAPGDNPGALTPITSSSELAKLRLVEHRVPTASLDNLANEMGTSRGSTKYSPVPTTRCATGRAAPPRRPPRCR